MEIGDLIFLILMGIGFLSSVGGAKKKRSQRKTPQPRPKQPQTGKEPVDARTRPERRSRIQEARHRVKSQMEDLLRELEEQSKPPQTQLPPLPKPESRVSKRIEPAAPVSAVEPDPFPSEIVERDGTLHQQFHDKYILPLAEPGSRSSRPRVRRHLNKRQQLREAILMREVLGPPKALE